MDKEGNEKEKLIELRFIDSFKFMSSSLDSLTKNLVSGGKQLFEFEDYSELQHKLLTRNGIVCPLTFSDRWFCNIEYFSMNLSLPFWKPRFPKSYVTSDMVYVPINWLL